MTTPTVVDDAIQTRYPEAQTELSHASTFTVRTADDYQTGIDMLRRLKRLREQWDARVRPTIRAAKKAHEEALALFKSVDHRLGEAYDHLKDRCEAWITDQRQARQEYFKTLSENLTPTPAGSEAALNAAFDEAVANGDSAKAARILDQAALPTPLHAQMGSAPVEPPTIPKVAGAAVGTPYTYDVVDEAQLPRYVLMPDRKKIAAIVKAMGADTNIPGIVVRPDTSLRIRS